MLTLISDPADVLCHWVRFVASEKELTLQTRELDPMQQGNSSDEKGQPQPMLQKHMPILIDQKLVLYDVRVIVEYLDERYPHPALMPFDPVARAITRHVIYRIQTEWCHLVKEIEVSGERKRSRCRKALRKFFIESFPLFSERQFFLNDELTLTDTVVGPLLWRLPRLGIELPQQVGGSIQEYMDRIFNRPSFKNSLSDIELQMRPDHIASPTL